MGGFQYGKNTAVIKNTTNQIVSKNLISTSRNNKIKDKVDHLLNYIGLFTRLFD